MSHDLEESLDLQLDFAKLATVGAGEEAVLPVVLQNADSGEVLFVGYANEQALQVTLQENIAVLWSTSRSELWRKGATSGDQLALVEVRVNCEQNSLLYRVRPVNRGVCHTLDQQGEPRPGCFYRRLVDSTTLTFVADQ